MEEFFFETRAQFRDWLEHHHKLSAGIWLVYYKKHTGVPGIRYDEAVEEALCFGWIDSKVQTIDELRYRQVFTPRNPRSVWSEKNKKRVEKLIEGGLMQKAGWQTIKVAKKNGQWENSYGAGKSPEMPEELRKALMRDPLAYENFNRFAPSYRKIYIRWVNAAKRKETICKRIARVVEFARKNKKPGML